MTNPQITSTTSMYNNNTSIFKDLYNVFDQNSWLVLQNTVTFLFFNTTKIYNAETLILEGSSSHGTFLGYYPHSYEAGRKAFIGYTGSMTEVGDVDLKITTEASGGEGIRFSTDGSAYSDLKAFITGSSDRVGGGEWTGPSGFQNANAERKY